MRKIIFILTIIFLLILAQNVFGASNVLWLRGADLSGSIEGDNHKFLSATPPSSSSTETIEEFIVERGKGELTRWYSTSFIGEFLLSGTLYFWASDFKLKTGNAKYRLSLYEFGSEDSISTLITSSEWFEFRGEYQEARIDFDNSYLIQSKNRLKLVLEYDSAAETSVIELSLDQPQPFQEIIWNSPLGTSHSAFGVKNTAAILLEICGTNSIACYIDLECDDRQPLTFDSCTNSGACDAKCVYTQCETECFSNAGCFDSIPLTQDLCLGLGQCNSTCSNPLCDVSCNTNSDCNDGNSNTQDECVYGKTCLAFCKNTFCSEENCSIEEKNICPNGLCEFEENCSADCSLNSIELLGVVEGEYFLYGDIITIKSKIKNFSTATKVLLSGDFGEQELFDNGQKGDERANDGVFSNQFLVSSNLGKTATVTINAITGETTDSLVKYYLIAPILDVGLETDRGIYSETGEILVTAFASNKGISVDSGITISMDNNGQEILNQKIMQNEYGLYYYEYKLSSLDSQGEINITATVSDEHQNTGTATKTVLFSTSGLVSKGLEIKFLTLPKEVEKKQEQKIEVEVRDSKNQLVENASVNLLLSQGELIELTETEKGVYISFFELSEKVLSGEQKLVITAKKIAGAKQLEAEITENIIVLSHPIEFEIIGLEKTTYQIGETVELKIFGKIDNKPTPLKEVKVAIEGIESIAIRENNYFLAKVVLVAESEGLTQLTVSASDIYENEGFSTISIELSGISNPHLFSKNMLLLFAFLLISLTFFWGAFFIFIKKKEHRRLKKQKVEMLKELKQLQQKYFKGGFMSRKAYDEKAIKLESLLNKINQKLGEKKK